MKRLDRSLRPRPGPPRRPEAAVEATLRIDAMGARGEGVAAGDDGPVYAPLTLPGEVVRARVAGGRASAIVVETRSPERVPAPCAHFGRCGGCQLQHWAEAPYLAWKHAQVVHALERRRLETSVDAIIVASGEGRRRAGFHAQRADGGTRLGFVERGGARIEPLRACPVLAPALACALPALQALAEAFAPARGEIVLQCLATESGLDVSIKGAGRPGALERRQLEAAAALADRHDLARLSFDGEPVAARRTPLLTMGRARVAPPPGAFVQATAAGERALVELVCAALAGAERVADLFCGVGTFALPLADRTEVHGADGDAEMTAALKRAADALGGLRGVTVERRDLLRAPLAALELKRFDAVVFDPPRAGARQQAEQIGASRARKVAAVSCDPATFARDVRVLVDAGFTLTKVTPIDQFRWTPHVEIVGVLER
jgi:23S rRNA (uracil1939-C5)-methyltransferase